MLAHHSRPRYVFISHTAELTTPWKAGQKSYLGAARDAVAESGNAVVEMGDFPAAGSPPAEVSVQRVHRSDVFVLVGGFLYGSTVPGRPDCSYVELEFEAATRRRMPRLVYLISDKAEGTADKFTDHENGWRQLAFRERLLNSGVTVKYVSSPEDLQRNLLLALLPLALPRMLPDAAGAMPAKAAPDEVIGEVCRLLATLAPDETKAASRHRDRGENGEALVVLKAAVDRLHGVYPDNRQDTREILYRIRLAAARQQRTANEELKRIMSESASRLARIPDDVVNTVRGEVGDIVGSLEPRTQAGRVPARHVEALYRDLAEQAGERVAGRLKRVTAESVDRILGQVLADIWSAPSGVLTAVDEYMAEKLPGEDLARRQMWSIVLPESDVRDMLESALAGVDSAILLREIHFDERSRAVEAILAKSGFSGLARTLLAFALRLIFKIAADDPGSLFSRDRLLAAVRRRVTDAMEEAVEGEGVRLALNMSVEMTQDELKAGQADTAQEVDRIVQVLRTSEFESWLTTHVAEQRKIVNEASARLTEAQA